jgi:hypothetical protein
MAKAVSAGMLMGARGNSGVILSRIFAGLAKGLADIREAGVGTFSRAMQAGVEESYHAVSEPVEGTILTCTFVTTSGRMLETAIALGDGATYNIVDWKLTAAPQVEDNGDTLWVGPTAGE